MFGSLGESEVGRCKSLSTRIKAHLIFLRSSLMCSIAISFLKILVSFAVDRYANADSGGYRESCCFCGDVSEVVCSPVGSL